MGQLYDRYGKAAYSLAFRISQDQATAESIVSEAILKCWNRIGSFRQARGGALGAWLLLTTYFTAMERRSPKWPVEAKPLEQSALFHGWSRELDGDNVQALFWGLYKLDPQEKQLLDLAFFRGLTPSDLTVALGCPRAEVERLITSVLAKLSLTE